VPTAWARRTERCNQIETPGPPLPTLRAYCVAFLISPSPQYRSSYAALSGQAGSRAMGQVFASAPFIVGSSEPAPGEVGGPVEEALCPVVSHEWVNAAYMHLVIAAPPKALAARPGQFFNLLCPSPDASGLWPRRSLSVYHVDAARARIGFVHKVAGVRHSAPGHGAPGHNGVGLAALKKDDLVNIAGPLGVGFRLDPSWRNIVVLGRGSGLATLAPLAQLAAGCNVGVTAILSARTRDLVMADGQFAQAGTVIPVLDIDCSGDIENVEKILEGLIAADCADAFFTSGSSRLMQLMKRLGGRHGIPGQVAMEQVMTCEHGPCYVCVRNFEVNGRRELRRVCIDGPVFDLQEAAGW
jgi:dihydroorotate dehydrogenase electron transfer subunit